MSMMVHATLFALNEWLLGVPETLRHMGLSSSSPSDSTAESSALGAATLEGTDSVLPTP